MKRWKGIVLAGGMALAVLCWRLYARTFYYTSEPKEAFTPVAYHSETAFAIPAGIWLHRVNSEEERGVFFHDDFSGFEMDVWYDASRGIFNVDHDNRDYGTTLEDMLAVFSDKQDLSGLWLDFKNLSAENRQAALARLNALASRFAVPRGKNYCGVSLNRRFDYICQGRLSDKFLFRCS